MINKTIKKINGKLKTGWEIPIEKVEELVSFNNWERYNVNPSILQELECRKVPKEVLTAFASGSSLATPAGAVFGICESRKDANKIDRDHFVGFLTEQNTIFITHDKDKSKKHNYDRLEELKDDINKNPPHEKDK